MHVGPASTPRILAAVIARYRARGFRFVTIPSCSPSAADRRRAYQPRNAAGEARPSSEKTMRIPLNAEWRPMLAQIEPVRT